MKNSDIFAMIKVLKVNNEIENNGVIFLDGMSKNYHLSSHDSLMDILDEEIEEDHEQLHEDLDKYASLMSWEDEFNVDEIDNLAIGTVFKGVSKDDSKLRTYTVVGKLDDGRSIWYPLSDRSEFMCVVTAFDFNEQKFTPVCVESFDTVRALMMFELPENTLYRVTDINANPIDILEDDDDDFDETNIMDSTYFVYKKDEDENGFISVKKMTEFASQFQIFRPLLNAYIEHLKSIDEEGIQE